VLEVAGLPMVSVVNDTLGAAVGNLDLDSLYGAPLHISLPLAAGRAVMISNPGCPAAFITWAAQENLNKAAAAPGWRICKCLLYPKSQHRSRAGGCSARCPLPRWPTPRPFICRANASQLTLRLYRTLPDGSLALLRTQLSPAFAAFNTTPGAASAATYQFSLAFHLAESADYSGHA